MELEQLPLGTSPGGPAEDENRDQDAEEARVQAIRDDLDRRYREEEEREQAERAERAARHREEEERERAEQAARQQALRKRGEKIIRIALRKLLDGDHRGAWRTLKLTRSKPKASSPDDLFYPAILSDDALLLTAIELEDRIDWSLEREVSEQDRIARSATLQSANLIDFDELELQLAPSALPSNRPIEVGVIYSITMPDGEVYIGKTTRDVETRWSEHLREAEAGDRKPKSLALRYWQEQGRSHDIRWALEETVLGWSEEDLSNAEKRWMRMGTLNVMDAVRVATLYPNI